MLVINVKKVLLFIANIFTYSTFALFSGGVLNSYFGFFQNPQSSYFFCFGAMFSSIIGYTLKMCFVKYSNKDYELQNYSMIFFVALMVLLFSFN